MFTIEKDIPVPSPSFPHSLYPFAEMKVGDSFLVKTDRQHLIRSAASAAQKRTGFTFRVQKVEGGARCWRTA